MQVTGAEMVFGGLAASPEAPVVLDSFVGARSDRLRNLRLTPGFGLGGKVVATGRPLRVRDYRSARGITHHYDQPVRAEQLRGLLAVPIRSATGVHGVLYAGMRRPTQIGDTVLDRAVDVARGVQQEIAVEAEVRRRLGRTPSEDCGTGVVDERLREVHAELALIRICSSGKARQLIDDLMLRITDATADVEAPTPPAAARPLIVPLTVREKDVITLVAAGHRNAVIGEMLGLTEGTVKAYMLSATRKLGVRNRIEAVNAARRLSLLP